MPTERIKKLKLILRNEGIRSAAGAVKEYLISRTLGRNKNPFRAIKRKRFKQAFGAITELIIGKDLFKSYLIKKYGHIITIDVNDYRMNIDLTDPGLSSELLTYGTREIYATDALEQELRRIKEKKGESVTVLEIGANIGYYALLEAKILGNAGNIHAFEPSPSNVELLRDNIDMNNFEKQVTVNEVAVGQETDTVSFEVTAKSNRGMVLEEQSEIDTSTVSVQQVTIDNYLKENNIDPESIDLIRMDVQGYEYNVFEGMASILDENTSLTLFFETHWTFMPEMQKEEIIKQLQQSDFRIVHASDNFTQYNYRTYESLANIGGEVILTR